MSNITIDDLKKIGWIPQIINPSDILLRYGNTSWYIDYSNMHKAIFSVYESPSIDVDYNFIFQYTDKPITFVELVKLMDDNYIV
jgi:hypothetical protein